MKIQKNENFGKLQNKFIREVNVVVSTKNEKKLLDGFRTNHVIETENLSSFILIYY